MLSYAEGGCSKAVGYDANQHIKGVDEMRFRRLLLSGCLLLIAAITVGLASGVLWRLPVWLLTFYPESGFASLFGVGLLLGMFAILAVCWSAWQLLGDVAKRQALAPLAVTALARLKWALLPVIY